jgi:isoleucyl-tRNA synthetase
MYLINSPVVRAEELKFKESGVLGVVKEVFLPWYNVLGVVKEVFLPWYKAFRFCLQNVERWEDDTGLKFTPSVEMVRSTKNSTDIWMSAATQELIKFVHDEMEAYRLYTALKKYILSELNVWEFTVVPNEQQHDWVTLSLNPNFAVLGKKVVPKLKAIITAIKKMSHEEAVKCLEEGKLVVEDIELDTATELISKISRV